MTTLWHYENVKLFLCVFVDERIQTYLNLIHELRPALEKDGLHSVMDFWKQYQKMVSCLFALWWSVTSSYSMTACLHQGN